MAEDFSFCHRVRQIGGRIVTERSIITGHVEVSDGLIYFPYRPPMVANGSDAPLPLPKDHAAFRFQQRARGYDMVSPYYRKPELDAASPVPIALASELASLSSETTEPRMRHSVPA
jgi:hypothetical protein